MSDDTQNHKDEIARQVGVSFEDMSEQLKAKYGPGSMEDAVEQLEEDLEAIFGDEPKKKIIISRDVDPLLYAGASIATLWWTYRKFKKTYRFTRGY